MHEIALSRTMSSERIKMVSRDHTQHYQSIKVLGGIYSRLRLILDRRLRELDKLALKNNSKDTRRIRASELSFTLNETSALELLLARPTDQNLIRKIIRLLRLKLLCTIETLLDDEIRSQIKIAEDDICGNTKIEFSVQQGQCHNFVKTRTESTLSFLMTKIQCHEFQLAHSETVILDLSGNPVFILSEVL